MSTGFRELIINTFTALPLISNNERFTRPPAEEYIVLCLISERIGLVLSETYSPLPPITAETIAEYLSVRLSICFNCNSNDVFEVVICVSIVS